MTHRVAVCGGVFRTADGRGSLIRSAPEYRQVKALEPRMEVVTLGPDERVSSLRATHVDVMVANHVTRTVELAALLGMPYLYFNHNGFTSRPWMQPRRLRSRLILEAVTRRARLVVATSREEWRALAEVTRPERLRFLPNVLDPDQFSNLTREESSCREAMSPHVLFVGHYTEAKGIFVLVEALALLENRSDVQVVLECVGFAQPAQVAAVEVHARRLGVRSELRFVPMGLDLSHLLDKLAHADLYVSPSFAEAAGTVMEEALAVGTPVVASAVGRAPEELRAARLFSPGNALELSFRLEEVLNERVSDLGTLLQRDPRPTRAAFDRWARQLAELVEEAM